MTEQAVRFRSFRAETFYQSATEMQTHEETAFARNSITHNSKRPRAKVKGPKCLFRPYLPFIIIATHSPRGDSKGLIVGQWNLKNYLALGDRSLVISS